MTIVIVALLQGKSKQEWAEAVKQSLETVPITPKDPKQDATPDEAEVSFGIDRSQKFGFSASESDSDHDEAEGMGRNSKIIRIGDYQVLTFDRKNTGRVIEEYDYEDEDEDEVEEDISSDDSSGNVIKKNVVKEAKHAGQQAHAIVADIKSPDDSENPKELLSTPASINTSAD
ncbi:hypothetical protein EV182_006941 [Spiromyces aspiralis]|uniref:Uncharacterized protein n=1 Tax=Spiromyces aspiralis TaxID=68401 RepID=A0ACC1HM37_9FUNG|nr:hypothetical protein EV182_006941 [Spiromyces aspiralis]